MPRTIQQIREEAIKILQEDYPKIKEGIYRLEVFMRRKSRKAVYELRDFTDHIAAIFRADISEEEAEKHLYECRTHLRRCSIEPLEYMAEKRFVKLDLYVRWFARIPFIRNNPTTKPEFFQGMKEIKNLIAEGRTVKTEGKACEKMDKAFGIATDLLSQIHPISFIIQGLLWLIGVFIIAWITAYMTYNISAKKDIYKKLPSNPTPIIMPNHPSKP